MINPVSKHRYVKLSVVVLICFFLATAFFFVKGPLRSYGKLKSERMSLLQFQGADQNLDRSIAALVREVKALEDALAQKGSAAPEALVPAFLEHVETLAIAAGIEISTLSPLEVEAQPPFVKIPFRMALSGSFSGFSRFISGLEQGKPSVGIDRFATEDGEDGVEGLRATLVCYLLSPGEALRGMLSYDERPVVFAAADSKAAQSWEGGRDVFLYPRQKSIERKAPIKIKPKPRLASDLGKLDLSAIFYDGADSIAFLNDRSLRVGDGYKGFLVFAIEKDRIFLSNDHEMVEILMRGPQG